MDILTENNMYGMSFILADQHAQQHTMDSAMKDLLAILAAVVAVVPCFAAEVALPAPPPSEYADTEASTNLAFSLRTEGRSSFEIAISLQASASNNLEVAFGCDADSDGELSAEEQSLTVGWDSGSWFLRDDATGELTSVPRADGQRRLDFRVMIDSKLRPRGLIARDGGVVFAYDARSMPSSAFDPDWNLVRVTARGFRNPMERLSVGFAPAGFSVHLK